MDRRWSWAGSHDSCSSRAVTFPKLNQKEMGEDAVTGDIAADEEGDEIQIPLVMEEPSVEPLDVENEGNTGELETEASSPRDDILRTLLDSYLSREAKYDALMRLHNERLLLMWRGYKQSVDTVTQRQQTLAIRSPRSGPNVVPDSRRYRGYGIDLYVFFEGVDCWWGNHADS